MIPHRNATETAQVVAPGAVVLGKYGESSPLLIYKDFLFDGGAGEKAEKSGEKWDAGAALVERYALQGEARRSMLEAHYRIPEEERPKRAHQVAMCRRQLRPAPDDRSKLLRPAIFRHDGTGATFYGGHEICGSPRACPVCAAKIGETRAAEIRHGVDQWSLEGGVCLFVTLTVPHYASDSLGDLLGGFKDALKRFRKGASFDRIKAAVGYSGLIRAFETTWGEANGWHPHTHEIWFCRPDELRSFASAYLLKQGNDLSLFPAELPLSLAVELLKVCLFERWQAAAVESGLPSPSCDRGLVVKVAETEAELRQRLAEYMAKTGLEFDSSKPVWGVDDEMVRVHSKCGKPGRFTPFDFLREQFNPENNKAAKFRYRCLFAEFVQASKGMASVYWSPGLKGRFAVEEVSDGEAADKGDEPASLLLEVLPVFWAFVIGVKDKDFRAQLLNIAREGGVEGARAFLAELLNLYYAEHRANNFEDLSYDAQCLLALPYSAFVSIRPREYPLRL